MDMSNEEIIKITSEIRSYKGSKLAKVRHFSAKYPDFKMKYPTLFTNSIEAKGGLDMIEYMLKTRQKILDGELSVDDGDKVVYGELQKIYIDPILKDLESQTASNIE
jgi:hypothetical protein